MKRLLVVAGGLMALLGCADTAVTLVEVRRDVPRDQTGVIRARVSISSDLVEAAAEEGGRISFTVEPQLRYPWIFRPSLDWRLTVGPLDGAPAPTGIAEGTAFRSWETFAEVPLDALQATCFAACTTNDPADTDVDTDGDTDAWELPPDVRCPTCAFPVEIRLSREDAGGWLRARLDLVAVVSAPGRSIDDDGLRIDLIDVGLE